MNSCISNQTTLLRFEAVGGARWLGALVALCLCCLGCQPEAEIETYTVVVLEQPAAAPSAPATAPAATGEDTDRMLAAIVPHADRAWFFKVVGPISAVDRQAQPILDFFATIRLAADKPQPSWNLPTGWTEQASTGMRAATISIPGDSKPLELSVIALPWTGGAADVLSNVNRWRGQLQLSAIDASGLPDCTREVKTDGTAVTIIDLAGRMQDTGMSAPFAGRPVAGGPAAGPFASGRPAAAPAASAAPPTRPASPTMPQFKTPAAWQPQPATPPRKAAYQLADGDKQALVTVIDFPASAGPMIADPLQNLNRWRREVGLPDLAADQLPQNMESFDVAGLPVKFFAVLPQEADSAKSQISRATLAAMVTHGDQIWFFKMTGDRQLVAAQREPFRAFVDSIRFSKDEGAIDGD